jgi:hypothetical protein
MLIRFNVGVSLQILHCNEFKLAYVFYDEIQYPLICIQQQTQIKNALHFVFLRIGFSSCSVVFDITWEILVWPFLPDPGEHGDEDVCPGLSGLRWGL